MQRRSPGRHPEETVFEARDAGVPGFPANVNVLAALSLAGSYPSAPRTKIYAYRPRAQQHRIHIDGESARCGSRWKRAVREPAHGSLSYLSTIALLRDLGAPLQWGRISRRLLPPVAFASRAACIRCRRR